MNSSIKYNLFLIDILDFYYYVYSDILINKAKYKNIPFHSDVVQLFNKSLFKPLSLGLNSFSANFYKMNGPTGIGILVTSNKLIEGYKLKLSNYSIPNIPAIAGAYCAFKQFIQNRTEKNLNILKMKKIFMETIESVLLSDKSTDKSTDKIIWLSQTDCLPNTILFGIKKEYDILSIFRKKNIIVANLLDKFDNFNKSSNLSKYNIIRISFSDSNNLDELKYVIKTIVETIVEKL